MVKVRQSKAKQESNPEVICVDSYKPKKISSKAVQSKKKQPWIDSGIVKLSTADKAVIKSPTGWLTDEIIDAAQNTLHEQFGVPGFQSVLRGQSCSFNVESEEFIQILHNGKHHWMTISTIGAKHPEVFAYDSLLCTAPDHLQQQIAALLKTGEKAIDVKFCKVAMQTNGSDCGVYAIAYATALCLGVSPAKLQFDENAMRPHLIKCLQDGRFTMFPVRKTCRKAIVKATQCIPIHCICRMPSMDGATMIECSGCGEWFHTNCVSPSPAALNNTEQPWYCVDCM